MSSKEQSAPLITNQQFMTGTVTLLAGGLYFHFVPAIVLGGISMGMTLFEYYLTFKEDKKHELDNLFRECGIVNKAGEVPKIIEKLENSIGLAYIFDTPDGLSYSNFTSQEEKIAAHFGDGVRFFKLEENRIHLQVQQHHLKEMYPANFKEEPFKSLKGMQFALGVKQTPEGFRYVVIDYDKVESHILISGGSGAGKSTLLRLLYTQFIMRNYTLHVIDAKLNEIGIFRNYPNLVVSSKPDEALDQILKLYDIMTERNHLFFLHGKVNIKQYNRDFPKHKLSYIVVVIDEFSPYRKNSKVKDALGQLLSMGRTAGIYIILSTQRIDSDAMGDLKTNLGTRFSMKAETKADSGIAMGQGDSRAYYITNAGRLYMKYGKELDTEVQVFNIETKECLDIVKDKLNGEFLYTTYQADYDLDYVTGLPISKAPLPKIEVTDNPLEAYRKATQREVDVKRNQISRLEKELISKKNNQKTQIEQPQPKLEEVNQMDSSVTINKVFGKGK